MNVDFTQLLINSQNADINVRKQAEEYLRKAQESNLPMFLVNLVVELANDSKPPQSRQMAGIILKNTLESKDENKRKTLQKQWKQLNEEVKKQVRFQVLSTLHSNTKEARKTAAQVLATISAIELPQNNWVDVIGDLIVNVTKPKSEAGIEASLVCLGYLCEECHAPALKNQSNAILTAVIQGMRSPNNEIKLAGANALYNALEFIHGNFQNKNERDFIMKVVCESTLIQDQKVRKAAMECLVKIAYLYYDHLKPYMEALFNITFKAAKNDAEEVALQAIEFWSTIAELEADIIEEIEYAQAIDEKPTRECQNFIKSALKHLVELLTQSLTRQEEYQSEEDWNISASAATCLALVSKVAGDAIVPIAMTFISNNINNEDWHFREAATLAFSAILQGPESKNMNKLVEQAIPVMLQHIKDPQALVKDTTVFTIGRIAQFHPTPLVEKFLDPVLKHMLVAMQDEARISSKAAWAIHNIAEAFQDGEEKQTYPLSQYFEGLVKALLHIADRQDASESNLRINAYAALSALITHAARDTYGFLDQCVQVFLQKLEQTLKQGSISPEEREQLNNVQGLLCGTLQVLTQKLDAHIEKYADRMMQLYLSVFTNKNATVHEEALMAVGSLATALGPKFERYMKTFSQFLYNGLRNHQEDQVCSTAVNIIGDLCNALGDKILPYCDDIVAILLQNLQSSTLNRNIKPGIISCFGDIALAIGGHFEKYLMYVAAVLKQAAEAQVDTSSDEMVDYLNLLRENILAAYTGILQGLKTDKPNAFNQYVDNLLAFLKTISNDETIDQEVFKNAVNVIGDLANVYGQKIKQLLSQEFVMNMVMEALKSKDAETRKSGAFAQKQMREIS